MIIVAFGEYVVLLIVLVVVQLLSLPIIIIVVLGVIIWLESLVPEVVVAITESLLLLIGSK